MVNYYEKDGKYFCRNCDAQLLTLFTLDDKEMSNYMLIQAKNEALNELVRSIKLEEFSDEEVFATYKAEHEFLAEIEFLTYKFNRGIKEKVGDHDYAIINDVVYIHP